MLPTQERPAWTREVLDFFAWRSAAIFSDWSPRSAPGIASALARRDWESLVVASVVSAPAFLADLTDAAVRAPREIERAKRSARPSTAHGRLRGRPLPRATLVQRVRRNDPTLWVVDPQQHVFQTEPNAALVGFLEHVRRTSVRSTVSSDVVRAVNHLLRTWPLREVQGDPGWAAVQLAPQLLAKVPVYRLVWRWAEALRVSRHRRDTTEFRRVLLRGWLQEEATSKLFELYALSRVAVALHAAGTWDRFRLVSTESRRVEVRAEAGELETRVLVDQTPAVAGGYAWILQRYEGIDGSGRRPDLQIVTKDPAGERTTFVEVKETSPQSPYGRDSVVKVLGYLKDYDVLWAGARVTYPRAVLLYSGDLRPRLPLAARIRDEVLLSSPATFDEDIAAVISTHLDRAASPAPDDGVSKALTLPGL